MNARRRDEAKVGTLARSATMQAPLLAQPDKRASLQRDRAIWADGCIGCCLGGRISSCHTVPSAQIARSRTRDLISASLATAPSVRQNVQISGGCLILMQREMLCNGAGPHLPP